MIFLNAVIDGFSIEFTYKDNKEVYTAEMSSTVSCDMEMNFPTPIKQLNDCVRMMDNAKAYLKEQYGGYIDGT